MTVQYLPDRQIPVKRQPRPASSILGETMPSRVMAIALTALFEHGVRASELMSPLRNRKVAWCRHVLMWRLRHELLWRGKQPSLPQIGRWLDRDHTSVLHGLRRYKERMAAQ